MHLNHLFNMLFLFQDPTNPFTNFLNIDFVKLVAEVLALAGFAAFVAIFVNIGKTIGFIKDGQAPKWVAGMNLIGVLALFFTRIFVPAFDVSVIDKALLQIALVSQYILSVVASFGLSKLTHSIIKGAPIVGKSYTLERLNKVS